MAARLFRAKRERAGRRPILQPALRVVAEAGWILVIYAALSVLVSHQAPTLGPAEMIVFVLAGVLVAWLGRPRPEIGALLLIGAVIVGGAIGWLASPDARALLSNLPAAFNVHLAGWFAGVAVLRGAVINTGDKAAEEIERLLRSVPVGLAVIWAYVSIAAMPSLWLSFAIAALWGTVMFLASAVVSIGMARLNILHADVVDERQRRGWRWLVIAIGFGIVPIAIPIGILAGIPLDAILTPVVGPSPIPDRTRSHSADRDRLAAVGDPATSSRTARSVPRRAPEAAQFKAANGAAGSKPAGHAHRPRDVDLHHRRRAARHLHGGTLAAAT